MSSPPFLQPPIESRHDSSFSVFVSPMSTVRKSSLSGESSEFARESPQSGSYSTRSSFTQPTQDISAVNGTRPPLLLLLAANTANDSPYDVGEFSVSTSTCSASGHQRAPVAQLRRSTGVVKSTRKSSNASDRVIVHRHQRPFVKETITPTAVPSSVQNTDNSIRKGGTPRTSPAGPAAMSTASPNGTAKKKLAPTRLAVKLQANTATNHVGNNNNTTDACGGTSPERLSLIVAQTSFQGVESPQDTAFVSDLGVSYEGVDWERVDADPHELFRQRNVVSVPLITRSSTKSNNETSLNCRKETVEPEHASFSRHEGEVSTAAGASQASPVRKLKQQQNSHSRDSSPKAESAQYDTEDPIDVCVEREKEEGEENGECSTANGSDPQHEAQEGTNASTKETSLDVTATTHTAPKDGEVNIFVAVRLRPCSEVCIPKNMPSAVAADLLGNGGVRCLRADGHRGFVDCSTIVSAGVLGKNSTGTSTSASAAAPTGVEKSDSAAGKRIRTLRFFFDHILDEHATQCEVMEKIGQRAVERVLAGYHGTVICYGQSGSGKTHTIVGPNGGKLGKKALRWRTAAPARIQLPSENAQDQATPISSAADLSASVPPKNQVRIAHDVGLLPRMLLALFSGLEARRHESDHDSSGIHNKSGSLASWNITFSALELYNEKLRDLLPHDLKKKSQNKAPAAAAHNGRNVHKGGTVSSIGKQQGRVGLQASGGEDVDKTSLDGPRYWNEELDVLNVVSSSDDEDEEDVEKYTSSDDNDYTSEIQVDFPGSTDHAGEMSQLLQHDLDDPAPDPSRPMTSGFTDGTESMRGRVTIGQLTSLSPPLATYTQRIDNSDGGGTVAPPVSAASAPVKKKVTVVGAKARNSMNSRPSGAVQTRISLQLPNAAASSKSVPPLRKQQLKGNIKGFGAGCAQGGQSGGSELIIRQREPQSSSTVTPTAAATTASFEAASMNSARSTSSRSRSRHDNAARDAAEAVYIEGLREHTIHNLQEAVHAVRVALRHRQMAGTELNNDSSRAHTFFFIRVEQRLWQRRGSGNQGRGGDETDVKGGKTKDSRPEKLVFSIRRSTLTLVDLAGSERVSHTGAYGLRLKEAQNINLSLSALGNVMRLLSSSASSAATPHNEPYIPYRDSKLTRILQSSLGGNATTFLLCNVSPDNRDAFETMSTLRFARLSKTVKNKAKLNESVAVVGENAAKSSAAAAALVEKFKKEQQVALAAVLAAESQLKQVTRDALQMRDRMQQMAAYVWWLEEQLGHFASAHSEIGSDIHSGEQRSRRPTIGTLPTLSTNNATDVRSGEGSSSGGAQSDAEKESDVSSVRWCLSPSPPSPPAVSSAAAATVTAAADTEGLKQNGHENDASIGLVLSPVASLQSAFQYWQSPRVRAFLSPSYSLSERQNEMQRRLVAAAATAGLFYSPTMPPQHYQQRLSFSDPQVELVQGKPQGFVSGSPAAEMYSSSLNALTDVQPVQTHHPVALTEEHCASEALQARLAETERQNLLLRLQLSCLRRQQHLEHPGEVLQAKIAEGRATDGQAADASKVIASATEGAPLPSSPTSLDDTSFRWTPSSSPRFQWPPHYSRESTLASLEAFIARCGFVPLDVHAASAGAASILPSAHTTTSSQQQYHNPLGFRVCSPRDMHSLSGIKVDPSSLQALRDGSAPRGETPSSDDTRAGAVKQNEKGEDDTVGQIFNISVPGRAETTSFSSVVEVADSTVSGGRGQYTLCATPINHTTNSYTGRGSSHRRPRVVDTDSPDVSPQNRSPGWGRQLLDSVRTTLDTVRSLSSLERFYEPDDINPFVE